jgi:hypothetical protein
MMIKGTKNHLLLIKYWISYKKHLLFVFRRRHRFYIAPKTTKPFMKHFSVKKINYFFITCLFVAFFSSELFAQRRNRQVLSIGPKVGANLSNFYGDVNNQMMQPGLSAGAILTYSVINTFGVSLEALYSQKGAKFENAPNSTERLNFNRRLNYVEVPLLARYFLNKEGDFRPNIFLGPSFGFKLNAKDVNRSVTGGTARPEQEITNTINPLDVGITGGIGLNFHVQGAMRALLDVRYTHGLSDVAESQSIGFAADPRVCNSALTISAGVSFGIGKRYEK